MYKNLDCWNNHLHCDSSVFKRELQWISQSLNMLQLCSKLTAETFFFWSCLHLGLSSPCSFCCVSPAILFPAILPHRGYRGDTSDRQPFGQLTSHWNRLPVAVVGFHTINGENWASQKRVSASLPPKYDHRYSLPYLLMIVLSTLGSLKTGDPSSSMV